MVASQRPARPGEYLIFAYGAHLVVYPTNGFPVEVVTSWLPCDCDSWAIVWAPSRTQAEMSANLNWSIG